MSSFEIHKIKKGNNEVSFSPSRGGVITSLKIKNKEILYFDEETFKNKELSIRGGIPILFPNGGDLKVNTLYKGLKRHGFARDMIWKLDKNTDEFKESLSSDEMTKKVYPYDFKLSVSGFFEKDGSFTLEQNIENIGDNDLPVSTGLHPYFIVPNEEKKNIKFNFEGGKEIEENFDIWSNGGTVYIDNPKTKNRETIISISIPLLGNIIINPSVEYKKIWIWSSPGQDFICIEPMMRDFNGLVENPEVIKGHSICKTYLNINLI